MELQPIAGALGAEVRGVDFSRELSNSEASAVYDAFLRHKVLYFHGLELTPARDVDLDLGLGGRGDEQTAHEGGGNGEQG